MFGRIDNIDLSDIRDSPRQIILKKKDFPSQLVGYITNATRVNFSKDKSKPTNQRSRRDCSKYSIYVRFT